MIQPSNEAPQPFENTKSEGASEMNETLHFYTLTEDFTLTHSVKEAKKTTVLYTMVELPHSRIPISSIGSINPENNTLILTSPNKEKATRLFVDHLNSQADVYLHTSQLLRQKAKEVTCDD